MVRRELARPRDAHGGRRQRVGLGTPLEAPPRPAREGTPPVDSRSRSPSPTSRGPGPRPNGHSAVSSSRPSRTASSAATTRRRSRAPRRPIRGGPSPLRSPQESASTSERRTLRSANSASRSGRRIPAHPDVIESWTGRHDGAEQYRRITDATAWEKTWKRAFPDVAVPEIDFEKTMVIAAFLPPLSGQLSVAPVEKGKDGDTITLSVSGGPAVDAEEGGSRSSSCRAATRSRRSCSRSARSRTR